MLIDAYRAIRSLLFTESCMICGEHVDVSMHSICPKCRYDIPTTNFLSTAENPVKERISTFVPIVHGSSFIFYSGNSIWRTMIHKFKYGGKWQIAYNMGRWYGAELKTSGLYDDIDVVIPIPLHPLKTIKRGYNQSTYLAEGIAKELGVSIDTRSTRRVRNNPAQARNHRQERWTNAEDLFKVKHPQKLNGKHILVVDDVLTTGATLISFIRALQSAMPECRISVATLAVTQHITKIR